MKIGLAMVSLAFDVVFLLQHYVLYGPVEETRNPKDRLASSSDGIINEEEPLLSGSRGD